MAAHLLHWDLTQPAAAAVQMGVLGLTAFTPDYFHAKTSPYGLRLAPILQVRSISECSKVSLHAWPSVQNLLGDSTLHHRYMSLMQITIFAQNCQEDSHCSPMTANDYLPWTSSCNVCAMSW